MSTDTETDVYLDVHAREVMTALALLEERVARIGRVMTAASGKVTSDLQAANASQANTMRRFSQQLRQLDQFERGAREQNRRPIRGIVENQSFSRVTRGASVYAQTLNNATNAAEGLQARLNRIDQQITGGGDRGGLASRRTLARRMGLQEAITELQQVDRQLQRTEDRARRTGQTFADAQRRVRDAQAGLSTAVLNPQVTNSTFTRQRQALRDAQADYTRAVNDYRQEQLRQMRANRQLNDTLVPASNQRVGAMASRRDLRSELSTTNDLLRVQGMREASNQRLDSLFARHAAARGREKLELEGQLRLENMRNTLIERRAGQLERAERAAARLGGAGGGGGAGGIGGTGGAGRPSGPESRLANIMSPGYMAAAFARTSVYGAAAMGAYGAFNTVAGGLTFVVQYEDALKRLQAIANATDQQMAGLARSIGEVGRESRFSLLEITQVATRLAQAGVGASAMPGALRSVTTLATASGSTPEESVDLVTASLGSFQLQSSEAARVADLMTEALNRTRLTVSQAALAIQYVGATAYEQNITLEQLLATTAALSQAGIRSGSTIGTGMRQFLVDLQSPSERLREQLTALNISAADVDVTTRGLPAVLQTLSERGFGAAQAYGSLETRAAAFYLVARNNLSLMDELQLSFAGQGAAMVANERAMNSLAAQWQRFKNIVEEGFADSLSGLVTIATNVLRELNEAIGRSPTSGNIEDPVVDAVAGGLRRFNNGQWIPGTDFSVTEFMSNRPQGSARTGDYLAGLSRNANDATGRMAALATATNRATEAVSEQQDTVSSLDREILRLTTQQAEYATGSARTQAETVTLMARFQGLSTHITDTTGSVGGLIGALRSLRSEQAETLINSLRTESDSLRAQTIDHVATRNITVREIMRNPALMAELGDTGRAALSGAGGDAGRRNAATLQDIAERLSTINPEWSRLVGRAAGSALSAFGTVGARRVTDRRRTTLEGWETDTGRSLRTTLSNNDAAVTQMRAQPLPERQRLMATQLTRLRAAERTLQQFIQTTSGINSPDAQRQAAWAQTGRREIELAIQEVQAAGGQTSDEASAAAAAGRAGARAGRTADREAQNITFVSPVRGTPRVTSGVGPRRAPALPGGGRGSSNHQGVDIGGRTGDAVYATADGVVEFAGERGSYGNLIILDHGGQTRTRYAHLSRILVRRGERVSAGQQIGMIGSTGGSTAPHLHYERRLGSRIDRNPLSATARGDPGALDQIAGTAEQRAARDAAATGRTRVGTRNRGLTEAMDTLRTTTTEQTFAAGEATVREALRLWTEEMQANLEREITAQDLTDGEAAERRDALAEQIRQKGLEINNGIIEALVGQIRRNMEGLQLAFEAQLAPLQSGLVTAQGRVEGLGYQSMQGRVPDFVQQLAARQVGRAQESLARGQLAGLPGRIAGGEVELARLQTVAGGFQPDDPRGDAARAAVRALAQEIQGLRDQHAQLQAAFSAQGLIPANLGQGLSQAIEAYRQANNLGRTFNEDIMMGMTEGIGSAHQLLTTFFTDLRFGVDGVLGAFKNLAIGIVNTLQQMAARVLANQIFNAILGLVSGAVGGGAGASAAGGVQGLFGAVSGGNAWTGFHGGQVRAFSGRHITQGVPGRDSVNAKIAKGEYVTRKWAVDNVGVDFMENLNNFGAQALDGLRPGVMLPSGAHQEMKVFVVAPETKPSMGPNDVLLTIADDILKDGQTKRLIQHVSQGG